MRLHAAVVLAPIRRSGFECFTPLSRRTDLTESPVMHTRLTSKHALGLVALMLGAAACHQTSDGYDRRFLLEADRPVLDLGTTYLPESSSVRTITLANTGRRAIELGALGQEAMQVDAPTFLFVASESTCVSGALMQPGQRCTIAFTFTPSENTSYTDQVVVSWTSVRDNPDQVERFSMALTLHGKGDVDCGADPAWSEAYDTGKASALAANAANHARGYEAGMALEHAEGHRRGYEGAYGPAYDSAYGPAYDRAYAYHYEGGYDEGWSVRANTYAACQSGGQDGSADGASWGDEDGWAEGYDVGAYDGAIDGSNEAWDRLLSAEDWGGVWAGCEEAAAYGASAAPAGAAPPSDVDGEAIAGMCEDKGFAEHRDGSAYEDGYAEGVADNADYQKGLREGRAAGTAEGTTDGTRSGTRDGREDGFVDGVDDGATDAEQRAYDDCYDAAYPVAYNAAFDAAYGEAYWTAYDEALEIEFYAVMDGYYADADCDTVLYGS